MDLIINKDFEKALNIIENLKGVPENIKKELIVKLKELEYLELTSSIVYLYIKKKYIQYYFKDTSNDIALNIFQYYKQKNNKTYQFDRKFLSNMDTELKRKELLTSIFNLLKVFQ
jgi:hypothetical protein